MAASLIYYKMNNAFISYSHSADGKLAPALERALEKFAKPWYKRRNLKIFRDEASLSASPHLWHNITAALDESDFLIYMASPESANSKWVTKEIEYWLDHKSLETLLIVLTDGEITWDEQRATFNNHYSSSLPSILLDKFEQEPFFLDLRTSKEQDDLSLKNPLFEKEILKLAAHIHGVEPKDLASQAVRVHRRMIWIRNGVASILVMLLIFIWSQNLRLEQEINEVMKEANIRVKSQSDAHEANAKLKFLRILEENGVDIKVGFNIINQVDSLVGVYQEYPFQRIDSLSSLKYDGDSTLNKLKFFKSDKKILLEIDSLSVPSFNVSLKQN